MRENVREEASRVKSLGFSYNIHNLYDLNDFLRFDLDLKLESKGFEALHANANKEKWKNQRKDQTNFISGKSLQASDP